MVIGNEKPRVYCLSAECQRSVEQFVKDELERLQKQGSLCQFLISWRSLTTTCGKDGVGAKKDGFCGKHLGLICKGQDCKTQATHLCWYSLGTRLECRKPLCGKHSLCAEHEAMEKVREEEDIPF